MKPYFLGIPLLVELYVLSQRGLRRSVADPAPWSILGICIAHALFAVIVTPEYFTVVWPIATAFYSEVSNWRSEEHTSELQSLMRISYAVFCLKKKNNINQSQLPSRDTTTH